MTLKALDEGAIERTISQIKVMDAGNVERTIAFVRVLGDDMVTREVFTAGGSAVSAAIAPANAIFNSGGPATRSAIFTASAVGGTATSFAWGVVSGDGYVSAGATSASATLSLDDPGDHASATFYCDVTISGVVHRATCRMTIRPPIGLS